MSASINVREVMSHAVRCVRPGVSPEHAEWHRRLVEAEKAVHDLIEALRMSAEALELVQKCVSPDLALVVSDRALFARAAITQATGEIP